jgi:sulfonate transport system permease protein
MADVTLTAGKRSTPTASPASPAPVAETAKRRVRLKMPLGLILPVLIVVAWWGASKAEVLDPTLMPSPFTVLQTIVDAARDGSLVENLAVSMRRWLIGFAIGGALGVLLGAATGLSRLGERLLDTTVQMFRTVPFMGLVPLLVIWFGIGELPKIILIAFAALFPLYLATYGGIRNIDRKLLEVGRVYELGPVAMFRRVVLPAALPQILSGVRLALGVAWLALVIAELNGAESGVGFWMMQGREYVRVDIVMGALVIFACVGKLTDVVVRLLESRLLSWRDTIDTELS